MGLDLRTGDMSERFKGGMVNVWALVIASLWLLSCSGCGATKASLATEQLLMSDAVDHTVSQIDFRPLSGKKVFLDTTYLNAGRQPTAGPTGQMVHNLVNSDYVVSSLRQQLMAAGCYLKENRADAEIICEARLGALATDGHSITWGLPANNALNSAASIFTNAPNLPAIPEIAIAKREQKAGAAKVAVFAYARESAAPVWQSGLAQANSSARDVWVMGIGPIQSGTIYKAPRFVGGNYPSNERDSPDSLARQNEGGVDFRTAHLFLQETLEPKNGQAPFAEKKNDTAAMQTASAATPDASTKR
jgi:hypothetical protein